MDLQEDRYPRLWTNVSYICEVAMIEWNNAKRMITVIEQNRKIINERYNKAQRREALKAHIRREIAAS